MGIKSYKNIKFKRQWGTEKNTQPLPRRHEKPTSFKIALSRLSIVLTIIFWLSYVTSVILRQFIDHNQSYHFTMEALGYATVVTLLTFSALMYLVARQGALQRFGRHLRVPRAIIEKHFLKNKPSITVLVPSYNEEVSVIRKTLISALLQEYPKLKVVLLMDNHPHPTHPEDWQRTLETRQLISELGTLFAKPRRKYLRLLQQYEKQGKHKNNLSLVKNLALHYQDAADWLKTFAASESCQDHVDQFFISEVIEALAHDLELVSLALTTSYKQKSSLTHSRIHQLYQRLSWIFDGEVKYFERKKYISLTHEANKAMNLNAYIGLMGGHYREEETPLGLALVSTSKTKSSTHIPASDYILTLDADSMLLREYCLRLVYFLEQTDNQDVAVAQTPYSSFRGALTRIERLAGATTDIQHILHQGMSYYGATFWVGANAVLRKSALDDIVRREWIGGYEVKRYIQDNTVIEDTESSLDLALKGWRLVNYPERLSYSATPSDFGALVVQRRRWANGGLLILPKLWTRIKAHESIATPATLTEILLRLNYMASIAWSSFGLLFLLAYPYDGRLLSGWVLLAATPYFIAMASDLHYNRYSYLDIFRIYGFNLILLPVNLAGVLKSIQQALTTKKIPFARTPKVKNRTAVGLIYLLTPLLIVGFSLFTAHRNIENGNWTNAAFAAFNAFTAIWAIVAYIGLGNLLIDMYLAVVNFLFVEVQPKSALKPLVDKSSLNWKSILYFGEPSGQLTHHSFDELFTKSNSNLPGRLVS